MKIFDFFKKQKDKTSKLVMAFGTFDLLHAGHEYFLAKAKSLGNELLIILARDATVKSVKGKKPQLKEQKRLKNIKNSPFVDHAFLGYRGDKHKVIRKYRPDVIALGYDQFIFTQRIEKTLIDSNINAKIIRIKAFQPNIQKTSLIKNNSEKK